MKNEHNHIWKIYEPFLRTAWGIREGNQKPTGKTFGAFCECGAFEHVFMMDEEWVCLGKRKKLAEII